MAKIPLRTYIKDIENQIERGEIEQAVAHAKNILKSYPKNIDTYRLLGKAYLESQRYSEAADILQRVLSVIPDDFVSQIGMSIIREDEGNLDASIWHMERAYEVQPFNPAVQEELRRLYGRRDGIEPPKIRLTRGALVRMYTRGELYPQAIAETRAALAEDPQRLDLLVLLARLYYLSDHKNDAAEACSELIRKLPYCYEANHLLAEILPSTNRAEETQKFLQRIFALDPYAAFISPTAPTVDQVPDQAVMVEQFTWEAAMEDARTPEWTHNVGVEWEEAPEEVLPDWLNTLKPEEPSAQSTAPAQASESNITAQEFAPTVEAAAQEPAKDELIPDWMKDAGWIPSDRKADEIMASQPEAESEEILPGELPDWVQSIAPQEVEQTPQEDERTGWLEDILAQPGDDKGNETGIVPPPKMEKDESQQGLPDWVTNAGTGTQLPEETGLPAGDLPDWFSQIAEEKQPGEAAPADEGKPVEFEGLPDWSQLGEPSITEHAPDAEKAPDWLRSFDLPASETPAPAEQTPDWLQSTEPETPAQAEETSGVTAWLESMQPETKEPAAEAEIPDWMQSISKQEEAGPLPEAGTLPEGFEEISPETGLPEASQLPEVSGMAEVVEPPLAEIPGDISSEVALEAAEPAASVAPEAMPDFSDMDAAMAWLESLAAKQGADEATLVTPPEQRMEQPPDWVTKEMESQETSSPAVEAEPPIGEEAQAIQEEPMVPEEGAAIPVEPEIGMADWLPADKAETLDEAPETVHAAEAATPPETSAPDFSDMDAAMAWLESLAAKQGADEGTLVTPPEQRLEQPPEWVTKEMESEEPSLPAADTETPITAEEPALPEPASDQTAVWLEQSEMITPEETVESAVASEEQPFQTEAAAPDFSDMDSAMAWLESLAAKQGADEGTLVTPPDQRLEQPPEWVTKEMEAQKPAEPESPQAEATEYPAVEGMPGEVKAGEAFLPAEEAILPDWLQDAIKEEAPSVEDVAEVAASETPIEVGTEPPAEVEQPVMGAPEDETQAAPAAEADLDSAFAWLESLAEKQGAQEGTLITTPEERLETKPDWVQKEQDLASETTPAEIPAFEPAVSEQPVENVQQQLEEQPPVEEPAAEELPDWLASIGQEEPAEPSLSEGTVTWPGETQAVSEQPPTSEPVPDWLQEPAAAEAALPETNALPEGAPEEREAVPDWLMGLEEEGEAEVIQQGVEAAPAAGDFRSAWKPEEEVSQLTPKPPIQTPAAGGSIAEIQAALGRGDLDQALVGYNSFIQDGAHLEETIHDLRDALYRYPVDISIWQTLGDAYARNNQLQEALDAYTKAEELLR